MSCDAVAFDGGVVDGEVRRWCGAEEEEGGEEEEGDTRVEGIPIFYYRFFLIYVGLYLYKFVCCE